MVCNSSDNIINPIPGSVTPLPGFDLPPLAPNNSEFPGTEIPNTGLIEDVLQLVNDFQFNLSASTLKPNTDEFTKSPLDAISNLFSQAAPFLAFLNFIMAVPNMIPCIIEVICAFPNPFKMGRALRRLFAQCLPPFLAIFPQFSLIVIILSILILLIGLIEYIITRFLLFINDLLANLTNLSKARARQDQQAINSITRKIAILLCQIENLFAILTGIGAIIEVIQALSQIATGQICASGETSECCSEDVCPLFISQNPNGITGNLGQLIYQKKLLADTSIFSSLPGFNPNSLSLPDLRSERWQFLDTNINATYKFADIISQIQGNIFWPEGVQYTNESLPNKVPYTVDLILNTDPFDGGGLRKFFIKDCIIIKKPANIIYKYDNTLNPNLNGTVFLEGGQVFEEDKQTPVLITGTQATLNTFIHKIPSIGPALIDDSIVFNDVEFVWKINYNVLISHNLITLGCEPNLAAEKNIQNAIINTKGLQSLFDKTDGNIFPDVAAGLSCLQKAVSDFRKNISPEQGESFQFNILSCLNNLKQQSLENYENIFNISFDQFNSTFSLNPTSQIIGNFIIISVLLKDSNNNNLATKIPETVQQNIINKLQATLTLGTISNFVYKITTSTFEASISSDIPGIGEITLSYDNKIFNIIKVGNEENLSQVLENKQKYTFISSIVANEHTRRNELDLANI